MNIYRKFNHSYPFLKYYARSMCTNTKTHHTRSPNTTQKHSEPIPRQKSVKPRQSQIPFRTFTPISPEQKNLLTDKIVTETDPQSVLYTNDTVLTNAFVSNLIIDMVYTTFIETGQGIALFDTQFNMKWKKFIVSKFSKIFSETELHPFIDKLSVLPHHLSNYTYRIKYFINYEYDRISFKKPVYIFPSDSFIIRYNEYHTHHSYRNYTNINPYTRNKLYAFKEKELNHRIAYLFENPKFKNGLYFHEISDVFESEHNCVLSLQNAKTNVDSIECLGLNPLFLNYYVNKDTFEHKIPLKGLLENAGMLYCYNTHMSRVMIFPNTLNGRFQYALLSILKNDDTLHTFKYIKTKLKEYFPDLYTELNYDRQTDITFTRVMLQRFGALINIYRVPTIDRHSNDQSDFEQRKVNKLHTLGVKSDEIIGDLYDLRYVRRYPHCLKVFNEDFDSKLYDLVRDVCKSRMIQYDSDDFVIGNNGVKLSEFERFWNGMYGQTHIWPFTGSDYALFFHIIEYQSHNIRALPIENGLIDKESTEFSTANIPFNGATLLSSSRSLYNRAHKLYYASYHFVPVQPYNNVSHTRLHSVMHLLGNDKVNKDRKDREIQKLVALKREYITNISYLLKTFRNEGIPLSDFARLFEFKYHNTNAHSKAKHKPLLSFNPDIIAAQIDTNKGYLNIGELHRSLSNILVVWGALITPKTKPLQQQLIFPLNLGVMHWMVCNCIDSVSHGNKDRQSKNYSIAWPQIKELGQTQNNHNSVIHKHRTHFFGAIPETKLWNVSDTAHLKKECFYKFAANITLTHPYIHSTAQLQQFWPNIESNLLLYRRPIAPIMDYELLTVALLYQTQSLDRYNKHVKSGKFYAFLDGLMEKYSVSDLEQRNILYSYLSIMTVRIIHLLQSYIREYESQYNISYIRWSTFVNRYESMFGRLIIPNFRDISDSNLIFAILSGGLHCNIIDCIGNKEHCLNYVIGKGHFRIPNYRGINQLLIHFPNKFEENIIKPLLSDNGNLESIVQDLDLNKYHKMFVPISFLLNKEMLSIKKYNNAMMSADINNDNWKNSDSFYALSLDPLTRHTVNEIFNVGEISMNLNDKFNRLLSRQIYSLQCIKDILSQLSDAQWTELSNLNLRHIVDGFVVRGELNNAHKILIDWFGDKLTIDPKRYELYNYLCQIYLNNNDLSQALAIFKYLLIVLHDLYDDRESNDDYYYEQRLLVYCLAQCCNRFIPKIMENGQFYLFSEIVDCIVQLKQEKIIGNIDLFMSNKNLKDLFKIFDSNDLLSRLLSLVLFIKDTNIQNCIVFVKAIDIVSLLQYLSSDNHRLRQEIINVILSVHNSDTTVIDWMQILKYAIKHSIVHHLMNNSDILHIYTEMNQTHSYQTVISLTHNECHSIVETYCDVSNNKLSIRCWQLMIEWIVQCSIKDYKLWKLCYFVSNECFQCLLSHNKGDAMKWIDSALSVLDLCIKNETIDSENVYEMNGIIILLQICATMNETELFCQILFGKLSSQTAIQTFVLKHYFTDIIECFINDDLNCLRLNNTKSVLQIEAHKKHSEYDYRHLSYAKLNKLKEIIKEFESKSSANMKEFVASMQKYKSLLEMDALTNNTEIANTNIYCSM